MCDVSGHGGGRRRRRRRRKRSKIEKRKEERKEGGGSLLFCPGSLSLLLLLFMSSSFSARVHLMMRAMSQGLRANTPRIITPLLLLLLLLLLFLLLLLPSRVMRESARSGIEKTLSPRISSFYDPRIKKKNASKAKVDCRH